MKRDTFLGVIFALIASVGFSAKAIFIKLAYLEHVDAITLLALRMAFSVPFFVVVAIWVNWRHAEPLKKQDWLAVLGLGLLGYYLSSLLDFLGLQYISAGLERLILFLYPTMTVILGALIDALVKLIAWRLKDKIIHSHSFGGRLYRIANLPFREWNP